jgi:hypothetical protein
MSLTKMSEEVSVANCKVLSRRSSGEGRLTTDGHMGDRTWLKLSMLRIYCLFNDAVSTGDYTASN